LQKTRPQTGAFFVCHSQQQCFPVVRRHLANPAHRQGTARRFTDEEILASTEAHAAHWELEATLNPEVASVCLDYAKHIRTMAECLRMDMLERDIKIPNDGG